ncbi:MAG: hypothetical protein ACYS4T_13325 [Planctomycetota bacterium]|jgi:hypothetical protein
MELEGSIQAMKEVEEAINSLGGIDIRSAYDEAVDTLKKSHGAVGGQLAVQYTRDKALAKRLEDMLSQKQRYDFRSYERMIGAYFEALAQPLGGAGLAQDKDKGQKTENRRQKTE